MIKALRESIVESTVHPIGRKPPEQYPLPPDTHVYGLGRRKEEEGVSIITRSWKEHVKSKPHEKTDNYIRINIEKITKRGKEKNTRRSAEITKRNNNSIRDDMVYGVKNRPSTPIADVINFEYANRAEKKLLDKYETFIKKKEKKVKLLPRLNKHFEILVKMRQEKERKKLEVKEPYKMKMFKDIKPKVVLPKVSQKIEKKM